MPAKTKSQQRLFAMALAVRRGDLARSSCDDNVLRIVDGDMTNDEIEHFTHLKNESFKHLNDYINEHINNQKQTKQ